MRTRFQNRPRSGLTFIEVLVLLVILAVLVVLLLPAYRKSGGDRRGIACFNNLRQLGLASILWGYDHEKKFPWELGVSNPADRSALAEYFRTMSNEVVSPKILACPNWRETKAISWDPSDRFGLPDSRRGASRFLSYFLNVDSRMSLTNGVLAGDSNVTNLAVTADGFTILDQGASPKWTKGRHSAPDRFVGSDPVGYVAFTDGSARRWADKQLAEAARVLVPATNRLLLP